MSYERDQMLKGIAETSWAEMDAFAQSVCDIYEDLKPESGNSRFAMAQAMTGAALIALENDAERKAAAKAQAQP